MLWLSCEGQMDVRELFSDNSYLSAVLDRQGLLVAPTMGLRTKKTEKLLTQLLQGFWSKFKKKNPKIVMVSPTVTTQNKKQKEAMWQQYRLCLAVAEYQIPGGSTFPCFGT